MAESFGKLRPDLEIHPEEGSGVIVKDPVTHRFYRFPSIQASVLELLDGSMDPVSIAERVSRKHQVEALPEQVEEFTEKLKELLLLEHPYCWSKLENIADKKKGRIRSLLHIKILKFNPDNLLTRLEKKFRFIFSSNFQVIFGLLAVIAAVISILNFKYFFISLSGLFSLYSIPLILIIVVSIITIHEFAHGITLKHYGGKSGEMGMMLLYFIPAFYCNVNDAWMLKKRQRILVALAGGYIQIFLWASAIIIWRLAAPETLVSRICLVSIAFSGIQALFNFNPLIRLDGYYMLSDFIELPNLRPKALKYLKTKCHALLTGIAPSVHEERSPREKRILLGYGIASFLFTAGLILFMLHQIGGWMIQRYRTWGVVMASTLLIVTVTLPNRGIAASAVKFLSAIFHRIRKSPKLTIAILLIAICFLFPWELKISGDFSIVPLNHVSVTPQISGIIKKIYVEQGSPVSVQTLLAEIENLELAENYQDTKGELAAQKANLDLLRAGSRPEEIEKARRQVETKKAEFDNSARIMEERAVLQETVSKKESELENARLNYERTRRLLENGLIARNEADRYRMEYEVQLKELSEARGQLNVLEEKTNRARDIKQKELAQANSELQLLLAGSRVEAVRAAESQVAKLEEKLKILEQELGHLKIRSPIEGIVATPYLRNRVGAYLDKGDMFCEIVSEGTVRIEMPVPEKEIGDVRVGMPITMKVRGYPHRWYQARVQSISPVTSTLGIEKTVSVYGELDNSDGSLKSGMTGVGKILCGKKLIAEIATRRAIRWLRTEFWEYLP